MDEVLDIILGYLSSVDLRLCRLVCWTWLHLLERLTQHREGGRLGWGWREGEPGLQRLQCSKERSVVTVTAMDVDMFNIAVGLGSCGRVEVWDRRAASDKMWGVMAHSEGVYSVVLGGAVLVSGGEDNCVRVWNRADGTPLASLEHHTYIVWCVRLNLDQLVTASYDCTVAFLTIQGDHNSDSVTCELVDTVQGPWEWADALYLEDNGDKIVVQDENIFVLTVWDVKNIRQISRLEGHTDEVNCVDMRGHLLVSGGCDTKLRLWDWRSGQCVAVLEGHGGKVWSVSCDLFRVASGGRGGEVRLWTLEDTARRLVRREDGDIVEDTYDEGRVLFAHPRSSSVASIHVDRFSLVSGDGMAMVIQWDFWASQSKTCPCKQFSVPVPDPLEL